MNIKGFPFVSLTTASSSIAAYLSEYSKDVTGAERSLKRNTRDDIYNILYTKESAQELAANLYYPGCLALDRKRDHAAAELGYSKSPCQNRRWKLLHGVVPLPD